MGLSRPAGASEFAQPGPFCYTLALAGVPTGEPWAVHDALCQYSASEGGRSRPVLSDAILPMRCPEARSMNSVASQSCAGIRSASPSC